MNNVPTPWFISGHAWQRAIEMGLDRGLIVEALDDSELDYPSYSERRTAVRGRLAVIYAPATRTVVTILWHGRESRAAA